MGRSCVPSSSQDNLTEGRHTHWGLKVEMEPDLGRTRESAPAHQDSVSPSVKNVGGVVPALEEVTDWKQNSRHP